MRKLPVAVLVFGILVGALIGGGVAMLLNGSDKSRTAAADAPAVKSVATVLDGSGESPAVATDASAAKPEARVAATPVAMELRIVALKQSMLEVRSAKGGKYVHRRYDRGEFFVVRVGAGFTVSAEDGAAFELRLGDESLGLLQPEGGPVYSQSIDLAVNRSQSTAPPTIVQSAE